MICTISLQIIFSWKSRRKGAILYVFLYLEKLSKCLLRPEGGTTAFSASREINTSKQHIISLCYWAGDEYVEKSMTAMCVSNYFFFINYNAVFSFPSQISVNFYGKIWTSTVLVSILNQSVLLILRFICPHTWYAPSAGRLEEVVLRFKSKNHFYIISLLQLLCLKMLTQNWPFLFVLYIIFSNLSSYVFIAYLPIYCPYETNNKSSL